MSATKAFTTSKRIRSSRRLASTFPTFAAIVCLLCAKYSYWEFRRYGKQIALQVTPFCRGKEKYVKVLQQAGLSPALVTEALCAQLPTEKQVEELYGSKPIVHGLETCETYRASLKSANYTGINQLAPSVRVTGLFNTGTNAFHTALHANLYNGSHERRIVSDPQEIEKMYGVPWFKHSPLEARDDWAKRQSAVAANSILTIILVREPYRWMQSMCKASYTVEWKRVRGHCPNLVPSAEERRARPRLRNATSFPVTAIFGGGYEKHYESLASMWSTWNREYVDADFPRLFVRFEDILFNAEQVMNIVADCAGLAVRRPYRAMLKASKDHGDSSNLLSAMIQYGTDSGRSRGLLRDDIEYGKQVLNTDLMHLFHYSPLKPTVVKALE